MPRGCFGGRARRCQDGLWRSCPARQAALQSSPTNVSLRTERVAKMRIPIAVVFLLVVSVVFCWTSGLAAQQLNDFAYGMRLITPSRAALVKLVLPDRLYRDLVQEDGGDIRVFAADGRLVPHFMPPVGSESGPARLLYFDVQAGQSYLLAYGSATITAPMPPTELVQRAERAGKRAAAVRVGPRIELGGPARLQPTAGGGSGWMISLSTLLLGCVLLLAFFAWWTARRLLRG